VNRRAFVTGLGAVLAAPLAYASKRLTHVERHLRLASNLLEGLGLFLVYQVGFVDGLFTSHPRWRPR
jgi:hypothetical protein